MSRCAKVYASVKSVHKSVCKCKKCLSVEKCANRLEQLNSWAVTQIATADTASMAGMAKLNSWAVAQFPVARDFEKKKYFVLSYT